MRAILKQLCWTPVTIVSSHLEQQEKEMVMSRAILPFFSFGAARSVPVPIFTRPYLFFAKHNSSV